MIMVSVQINTMIADINQEIVKAYDVQSAGGMAFRDTFLID